MKRPVQIFHVVDKPRWTPVLIAAGLPFGLKTCQQERWLQDCRRYCGMVLAVKTLSIECQQCLVSVESVVQFISEWKGRQ